MMTIGQLACDFTEKANRDADRKKDTIRKIARFAWGAFSYWKGPPTIEGDLSSATAPVAIQALSKQMQSGFQDVKLDAAVTEGIDMVAGWIMDLLRPSENQMESQLAILAMTRGMVGPTAAPMAQPQAPYMMPAAQPMPAPYPAPRPMIAAPGTYGGSPAPRYAPTMAPSYPFSPFRGRIANQDGHWVYIANDSYDAG